MPRPRYEVPGYPGLYSCEDVSTLSPEERRDFEEWMRAGQPAIWFGSDGGG